MLVYRRSATCCADCHIAGWDDFLIFSPLWVILLNENEYTPFLEFPGMLLVVVLLLFSVARLIVWALACHSNPRAIDPKCSPISQKKICENCKRVRCIACRKNFELSDKTEISGRQSVRNLFREYLDEAKETHYPLICVAGSFIPLIMIYAFVGQAEFVSHPFFYLVMGWELFAWLSIYKYFERHYNSLFDCDIANLFVLDEMEEKDKEKKKFYKDKFVKDMFKIERASNMAVYFVTYTIFVVAIVLLIRGDALSYIPIDSNFGCKQMIVTVIFLAALAIACRAIVIFYNAIIQFRIIARWKLNEKLDKYICFFYYNDIKLFCDHAIFITSLVCLSVFIAVLTMPIKSTKEACKIIILFKAGCMAFAFLFPFVISMTVYICLRKIELNIDRASVENCKYRQEAMNIPSIAEISKKVTPNNMNQINGVLGILISIMEIVAMFIVK